jgi:hypothetical protein
MRILRPIETSAENSSDFRETEYTVKRRRSRSGAWRDGLTSQTVIENLENAISYQGLERSLIDNYGPQSVIELELVHRLASLFWRLRRASVIETGLLQLQADHMLGQSSQVILNSAVERNPRRAPNSEAGLLSRSSTMDDSRIENRGALSSIRTRKFVRSPNVRAITQCFIQLLRTDPALLDRVSSYEKRLWHQAAQVTSVVV